MRLKQVRLRLSLLGLSLVVLLVVTTFLSNSPRDVAADQPTTFTLKWVIQLDTVTNATVNRILINGHDDWNSNNAAAVILTTRPEVIIIKLKDSTIIYRTGKTYLPSLPGQPLSFIDNSVDDDDGIAWVTGGSTPQLFYFDKPKSSVVTVTLSYKSDPTPTALALAKNGKFVLVGDQSSHLALYESSHN